MVDVALNEPTDEQIEPGWYPEPDNPGKKRYWDGEQWGEQWREPRERPKGKANRLAVTALILSCVGPPFLVGGILATIFGTVALDEIEDSEGAERGESIARWAIGLGFLNVIVSCGVIVLIAISVSR